MDSLCPSAPVTMPGMKNRQPRSPQEIWLRQALESRNFKPQIVDAMYDVLRSFFSQAKQTRIREKAFAAAYLESLVLGTEFPMREISVNPIALLNAVTTTTTQETQLCQN